MGKCNSWDEYQISKHTTSPKMAPFLAIHPSITAWRLETAWVTDVLETFFGGIIEIQSESMCQWKWKEVEGGLNRFVTRNTSSTRKDAAEGWPGPIEDEEEEKDIFHQSRHSRCHVSQKGLEIVPQLKREFEWQGSTSSIDRDGRIYRSSAEKGELAEKYWRRQQRSTLGIGMAGKWMVESPDVGLFCVSLRGDNMHTQMVSFDSIQSTWNEFRLSLGKLSCWSSRGWRKKSPFFGLLCR